MRNLRRNLQPVFYKLYLGQEEIVDEYNNPTGSFIPKYGPLQSAMLCVSPNKGSSEYNQFGTLLDYDRTATTADTSCDIDEDAVLWVDDADTDGPWNAVVQRVGKWKNSISYALKTVSVSFYQKEQERIAQAMAKKAEIQQHIAQKAVTDDADNNI